MSSADKIVIAFDLYGTLLSTESIAKELASHFGDNKAQTIATLWRRYQLEYTWRLNSMSLYKSFSEITRSSLNHALAESSEKLSEKDIDSLMQAYDSLSTFPEVEAALTAIAKDSSIDAYVLSNGTDSMVSTSVNESPSLSPHAKVFKELITVEEIRAFKPDPRVYQHLAKKVGKSLDRDGMSSVWLVSGNPFDVVGARAAGCQAAWVDRTGHHGTAGWNDRLGALLADPPLEPTLVVKGIDEVVSAVKEWVKKIGSGNLMNASSAGHNRESAAMGPG